MGACGRPPVVARGCSVDSDLRAHARVGILRRNCNKLFTHEMAKTPYVRLMRKDEIKTVAAMNQRAFICDPIQNFFAKLPEV